MKYCPQCDSQDFTIRADDYVSCTQCGFVDWQNPTPVAAAVIEYQDHILLVRNVDWPAKLFALVTGFVERLESPEETVLREIKEETNLDAKIVDFLGHRNHQKRNQLLIGFHCVATGNIQLKEDELAEYRLIAKEKLRSWATGTGPFIQTWIDRNLGC